MLKFGSKKFSDVRWDSNLRCQDNDLIKISIFKNHKSSNILLCANFRQWDAIVFGSPMLRGRIGYGVVLLQRFAHSLFEPWKWSFLLSKSNILRKVDQTCNFQLLILVPKTWENEKISYRPFIIHFKVSKNYAKSISLMTPLSTFVHWTVIQNQSLCR